MIISRHMPIAAVLTASVFLGAPASRAAPASPATIDASGGDFSTGGDTIHYRMAGSGPVMFLIHGFPLSSRLFEHQLASLSSSYTVIAPDLPGFGRSTTGRTDQTDRHYADDMIALLDHLGVSQAIIGGHSMGGQVTLEMYRLKPALFRGMVLFDTNPARASIVEIAEWPAYGRMSQKMGVPSIAPPVVGVMVTGDAIANDPSLETGITSIVDAASARGVVGGGNALATRPNFVPTLGDITVPTLVVCGQDDPVYPLPISQALAAAIPGATLAVIDRAAHASMYQRPVAVNAAIIAWAKSAGF